MVGRGQQRGEPKQVPALLSYIDGMRPPHFYVPCGRHFSHQSEETNDDKFGTTIRHDLTVFPHFIHELLWRKGDLFITGTGIPIDNGQHEWGLFDAQRPNGESTWDLRPELWQP